MSFTLSVTAVLPKLNLLQDMSLIVISEPTHCLMRHVFEASKTVVFSSLSLELRSRDMFLVIF